ncbi:MAG TPA: hypothetical protein VF575_05480 [Candidatus Saccharimonadales bacterium]|jgi:hypothetical protein
MPETFPRPSAEQNLDPSVQDREAIEHAAWQQTRQEFADAAFTKLEQTNPELMEGKVAQQFAEKLKLAGYDRYAVGFNQSDAIQTIDEAEELLDEQGGVALGMYNIYQRFLIHDQESPMPEYTLGYYGPRAGRFVYVFPVDNKSSQPARVEASHASEIDNEHLPADMFLEGPDEEPVVNSKYCVGFIDGEQNFHPNEDFMEDAEGNEVGRLLLSSGIGETALGGEGLATPSEEDNMAETVDAAAQVVEVNGTDIDSQSQKFEGTVKERVHSIWTAAMSEGRHQLTSQELSEIKNLSELVTQQRKFTERFKQSQENSVESDASASAQNAQRLVDRYAAIAQDRGLNAAEKLAYRKAKLFLHERGA